MLMDEFAKFMSPPFPRQSEAIKTLGWFNPVALSSDTQFEHKREDLLYA